MLVFIVIHCHPGSNSGQVCLWKCGDSFRSLDPCLTIPLVSLNVVALILPECTNVCTHCHSHVHIYIHTHIHTHAHMQAGFIYSLVFSSSGNCLVAGVGQEHRFGRWWRDRNCKNGVVRISLHMLNN